MLRYYINLMSRHFYVDLLFLINISSFLCSIIIITDHRKKGSVNEDGEDDKEGLGKGKLVNEIQFITIAVRFNITDQNIPKIQIDMSSEASVKDIKNLVIQQKPFLKPKIEQMCFIFGGKR